MASALKIKCTEHLMFAECSSEVQSTSCSAAFRVSSMYFVIIPHVLQRIKCPTLIDFSHFCRIFVSSHPPDINSSMPVPAQSINILVGTTWINSEMRHSVFDLKAPHRHTLLFSHRWHHQGREGVV